MANIPYQSSGTPVSQVENDVAQTLNLAGSIVTIIREPIAHIYETYTKAQKIRKSLGIWQKEILDENGQPRIPVLRHQEFEDYLVKTDGIIPASQVERHEQDSDNTRGYRLSWPGWGTQNPNSSRMPTMPPAGTSCWGYFLFALGIRPEMGTVSRRPSTDGFISTQNGGVEMEIDGSALCHVMNLYDTRSLDRRAWCHPKNLCSMSFGTLSWEIPTNQRQVHAHFSPGTEQELASEKRPSFSRYGTCMDVGTIMVSYLTALHHGVSDQRFQLAAPQASLSERIERLLECFLILKELRMRRQSRRSLSNHLNVDGVILFSHEWFDQAASVKRRLLTKGGDDRSFFDDVYGLCSDERHKKDLTEFFFFEKQGFDLKRDSIRRCSALPELSQKIVMQVLLSYETCPPGSWKRDLFERREDVVRVAAIPKSVFLWDYDFMSILWYTPNSDMWKQTVLLGAPTSVLNEKDALRRARNQ
ncbi:hypothetical protein CNYM01_05883 [Colletotrichum nymphaeae SA-01]|uniref:Uncharacterized protein n=1 Tax=Colletotrichum nymphaeae SA-01 TaxID=1460502 RepID=A0A135TN62_9PEZI|nr:hypothetical protein CNYM01_05883 [Colletotrichum nymphaeae SA-01]